MEKADNQAVTTSRDRLKSRLSQRYPERSFVGEDGIDAQDVMDDSLEEMFGEYESRENEYNENRYEKRNGNYEKYNAGKWQRL